jgi:hypothetical protein
VTTIQKHFQQYHKDMDVSDASTSWNLDCGIAEKDWFPLFEFCEAPFEVAAKSCRKSRKQRMYALYKFCPGAKCLARSFTNIKIHAESAHPEMVRARITEVESESKAKSDGKEAQSHATSESDSD